MIVNTVPEIANHLVSLTDGNDSLLLLLWNSLFDGTVVLGQTYDIFANMQKAWSNFLSTGQAAAFVIGIFVGWFIKGIMP
ncbi:hypothetical protein [Kamptonema sp. UHCC 0994]|uniref:hypothetical protein n=1 Tax=Kamptonema sp. UHCC 0994 TaxID=3031329 RepID=UPI0023B95745|nr:hypothetical protein [Kamptonema sp. UHCC 0994]MDF0552370.1 hypothetical protein [Kamptonema sp. UHCC 0994]